MDTEIDIKIDESICIHTRKMGQNCGAVSYNFSFFVASRMYTFHIGGVNNNTCERITAYS